MEMSTTSYHIPKPFLNSSCYTPVGVSATWITRFPVAVIRNRRSSNRKTLKVVKAVAAASTARGRAAVNGGSRSEQELQSSSNASISSSALEQLDIERGVCIPFRKYTPDTVSIPCCMYMDLTYTLYDQ